VISAAVGGGFMSYKGILCKMFKGKIPTFEPCCKPSPFLLPNFDLEKVDVHKKSQTLFPQDIME
jgi:hypothetical protein